MLTAAGRLGDMKMLPASDCSLLVRTDFASEHAWQQVSAEAQAENADASGLSSSPSLTGPLTAQAGRQ
jgi:hypothetical protein